MVTAAAADERKRLGLGAFGRTLHDVSRLAAENDQPAIPGLITGRHACPSVCPGWLAVSGGPGALPISSISARTTSSRTAMTMTAAAVGWPQNTKISAARAT